MTIDSSAVVALIEHEADAGRIRARMAQSSAACMSLANYLETVSVLAHRPGASPPSVWRGVDRLLAAFRVELVPVDLDQTQAAIQAMITYGKGFHPARLNFGDCFAYGLAKVRSAPLLFVGNDFIHTDIEPALV